MSDGEGISERLAAVIAERGLGVRELARSAGLASGQISNLRNGKRGKRVGGETIAKLAHALDVNDVWLLTGEGPRERRAEGPVVEAVGDDLPPFDAARAMFLAEQVHDGHGDDARRFLAERVVHYAGAEGRSPGWWLETLKDEFRAWRKPEKVVGVRELGEDDDPFGGPSIPAINPRRRG